MYKIALKNRNPLKNYKIGPKVFPPKIYKRGPKHYKKDSEKYFRGKFCKV
jgi:hypothetical protein